jgi:hypothetical protein
MFLRLGLSCLANTLQLPAGCGKTHFKPQINTDEHR